MYSLSQTNHIRLYFRQESNSRLKFNKLKNQGQTDEAAPDSFVSFCPKETLIGVVVLFAPVATGRNGL